MEINRLRRRTEGKEEDASKRQQECLSNGMVPSNLAIACRMRPTPGCRLRRPKRATTSSVRRELRIFAYLPVHGPLARRCLPATMAGAGTRDSLDASRKRQPANALVD